MTQHAFRATAFAGSVLALILGLSGCSREADDWRSAQAADTSASYGQFLKQYPGSAHGKEATLRLAQLAEDEAWQSATVTDSQMGYQQFLARYPEGKWAQEARVRIENFSLTPATPVAAPVAAVTPPAAPATPATPAKPAATIPVPPPAPPSASPAKPVEKKAPAKKSAASAPASGFGVQLGAFSSKGKAEAAWAKLDKAHKAAWGGQSHQVIAGRAGTADVFRLRVPQASEAAARKLCERLKAAQEACVVYRP